MDLFFFFNTFTQGLSEVRVQDNKRWWISESGGLGLSPLSPNNVPVIVTVVSAIGWRELGRELVSGSRCSSSSSSSSVKSQVSFWNPNQTISPCFRIYFEIFIVFFLPLFYFCHGTWMMKTVSVFRWMYRIFQPATRIYSIGSTGSLKHWFSGMFVKIPRDFVWSCWLIWAQCTSKDTARLRFLIATTFINEKTFWIWDLVEDPPKCASNFSLWKLCRGFVGRGMRMWAGAGVSPPTIS